MEDDKAESNATESSHLHFLKQLPKVELHAHLNGCVRETTLFELAKERKIVMNERHFSAQHLEADDLSMYNVRPRSLEDCFEMFAEISKCVDDLAALERITMEALEDFADHHVAYLELRSTPKRLLEKSGGTKMSDKRVYCRTVLDCMRRFQEAETARFEQESSTGTRATMYPRLPLKCRLIVAIDRSQSVEDAYEHVELAIELRNEFGDLIVGVDLCGNPTKNCFRDFRAAFEAARKNGLKITLHCGEVSCVQDQNATNEAFLEAQDMLDFCPDRLGHALLLPPELQETLLRKNIPVESCPTSNVMTLELASHHSGSVLEGLRTHPQLPGWIRLSHPFSIGTDDPGVFHTNNTKEVMLVQKAFGICNKDICRLIISSMDHAFCSIDSRTHIKMGIRDRIEELLFSSLPPDVVTARIVLSWAPDSSSTSG